MKYVKWIFVVLLIGSLTSFVEKDKPTGGLNVGDIAPDFKIQSMSAGQPLAELSDMKGKYVLLSFWASYDAHSRMQNASLSNVLRSASRNENVEMVSVSFDEYQSIFKETVRKDQIVTPTCFVETKGESSGLFKKYRLGRGCTNYLLDENYCQKHLCCRAFSLLELNNSDTHCDRVSKEPVRRKWGLPTTSSLLVGKKNKTKEEMNTTKKPSRTCGNTRAGRLLIF